ncbi:MAG: tRNA (adenosine(37)-N6)-dimethylallyltransferase MiaA [Bacteroidales bacterium]
MSLLDQFIKDNINTQNRFAQYDALCILGPTASGKTKFAVEIAIKLGKMVDSHFKAGAEIISADSRQVYRGMDIGTGKDIREYTVNLDGDVRKAINIPCHLINIVDAGTKYNIFEYQRDFAKAYSSVRERGLIPIICGGSGLYIEAATMGYELKEVAPNDELRESLKECSMEELTTKLTNILAKKGHLPHNNSDFDSKKRVIRAIEIAMAEDGFNTSSNLKLPQKCLYVGIDVDRNTRNARIDARLRARLEEGMIEEVKRLLDSGIPAADLIYYGLEYKFITQYIMGELGYNEMVEKLAIAIHQFAKRQMTWFRGMERKGVAIEWIS